MAFFQENQSLIDWANKQALAEKIACLRDGHDGVWNIIKEIGNEKQRLEILDWFHLKENLYKVGGSIKRLKKAESLLWKGKIEETQKLFLNFSRLQAQKFWLYRLDYAKRGGQQPKTFANQGLQPKKIGHGG